MSDLGAISGKPVTLRIGKRSYRFAPLTLGDIAGFEQWVRSRRLQEALEAIPTVTSDERAALVRMMVSDSSSLYVQAEMTSVGGMLHLLWLSLKHYQGDMTEEEAGRIIDMRTLPELNALIDTLMATGSDDQEPEESDSPPVEAAESPGPP